MENKRDTVKRLAENNAEDDFIFSFLGAFSDDLTAQILELNQQNFLAGQHDKKFRKKLSILLVESFQNIIRHGNHDPQPAREDLGFFCLRHDKNGCFLSTINLVPTELCAELLDTIENINKLDAEHLKKEYLQKLTDNEWSTSGGAGLGLLEVARKSGHPIMYNIRSYTASHHLLHLKICLTAEGYCHLDKSDWMTKTENLRREMIEQNNTLLYKGEITQHTLYQFMDLSRSIVNTTGASRDELIRFNYALIEILQNMSRHGCTYDGRNVGYLVIGQDNGHIRLEAGNEISQKKYEILKDKLSFIGQLSHSELKRLHTHALHSSVRFENKSSTGLGLIEIFLNARDKVDFALSTVHSQPFFRLSLAL
ncbi:MAG: SiaB family protein kinase [Flavobacteriales bacterium]|nr:SiaB family protein kinase [Flavobacteriales bacterium]